MMDPCGTQQVTLERCDRASPIAAHCVLSIAQKSFQCNTPHTYMFNLFNNIR